MLRALRTYLGSGIPVIGVNFGRVGLPQLDAAGGARGRPRRARSAASSTWSSCRRSRSRTARRARRRERRRRHVGGARTHGRARVGGRRRGPRQRPVRRDHLLDALRLDRVQPLERRPGADVGDRRDGDDVRRAALAPRAAARRAARQGRRRLEPHVRGAGRRARGRAPGRARRSRAAGSRCAWAPPARSSRPCPTRPSSAGTARASRTYGSGRFGRHLPPDGVPGTTIFACCAGCGSRTSSSSARRSSSSRPGSSRSPARPAPGKTIFTQAIGLLLGAKGDAALRRRGGLRGVRRGRARRPGGLLRRGRARGAPRPASRRRAGPRRRPARDGRRALARLRVGPHRRPRRPRRRDRPAARALRASSRSGGSRGRRTSSTCSTRSPGPTQRAAARGGPGGLARARRGHAARRGAGARRRHRARAAGRARGAGRGHGGARAGGGGGAARRARAVPPRRGARRRRPRGRGGDRAGRRATAPGRSRLPPSARSRRSSGSRPSSRRPPPSCATSSSAWARSGATSVGSRTRSTPTRPASRRWRSGSTASPTRSGVTGRASLDELLERRVAAAAELERAGAGGDPLERACADRRRRAGAVRRGGARRSRMPAASPRARSPRPSRASSPTSAWGRASSTSSCGSGSRGRPGADEAVFLVRPNAGLPLAPVAETASGGELSRVALAIAAVAGGETVVLDEIDAGVGGVTAHRVADVLRRLAERAQVLTITHLPQIASVADQHLRVEKVEGDPTHTRIAVLDDAERRDELERMLGGEEFVSAVTADGPRDERRDHGPRAARAPDEGPRQAPRPAGRRDRRPRRHRPRLGRGARGERRPGGRQRLAVHRPGASRTPARSSSSARASGSSTPRGRRSSTSSPTASSSALDGGSVWRNGTLVAEGTVLDAASLEEALADQQGRVSHALEAFAENTLRHLQEEAGLARGRPRAADAAHPLPRPARARRRPRPGLQVRPADGAPVRPRLPARARRGRRRRGRAARGRARRRT